MRNPVADWLPALTPRRRRQLWYAPLLALAMGLMMARLLLMARLLDVSGFGAFSGGILISSTFCMLGCLGLQSLLQREWPVLIVRGQQRRALALAGQGALVATACAGAVALCTLALQGSVWDGPLWLAGLAHGLSQQIFLLSTVDSRSRGDTVVYAVQNLSRAALALALSLVAAQLTGSPLAVLVVDAVATLLLSARYFAQSVRQQLPGLWAMAALALRRMHAVPWRATLVLMSIGVVGFVQLNLDRWVAADRLDVSGFAQYSLAWIVLSVALSAQAVINAAVFPAVARRHAEQGRRVAFIACLRASVALLVSGALAALAMWPLLGQAIDRWYPRYTDATSLLPMFLAIGVLRTADFWSTFLLVAGRERQLLLGNVASLGLALAAWGAMESPAGSSIDALRSVAWLSVLLTSINYAVVVALAWRSRS